MSIALGFIKGLVGGFTQNIAQEQQARGADDQRVAELENLMVIVMKLQEEYEKVSKIEKNTK